MRVQVLLRAIAVLTALLLCLPTPGAATPGSDFCLHCDTSGLRYRLSRGDAEVSKCEAGLYCDCDLGTEKKCFASFLGRRFNQDTQTCQFNLDCRAWFSS